MPIHITQSRLAAWLVRTTVLPLAVLGSAAAVHAGTGPVNRIERAGSPAAFQSLWIANRTGAGPLNLSGEFTLRDPQSHPVTPSTDRIVVTVGAQVAVLPPGSLSASGASGTWVYENNAAPVLRKLHLQKRSDTIWHFELGAIGTAPTIYLRIGGNWGGVDLSTNTPLLTFRRSVDAGRSVSATVGAAGGTIRTVDAVGAKIKLSIPAGALTQDTAITMTPLLSPPWVIDPAAVGPGVEFLPEGLHFAYPATLTYDFSAASTPVTPTASLFLATSPMTMLPLLGKVDLQAKSLTASLFHFSDDAPANGSAAMSDLTAWANAALSSPPLTQEEIMSLLAVVAAQQTAGCSTDCVDLNAVTLAVETSVQAVVAAACTTDIANPTMTALQNYVQLDALVQQVGGVVPAIVPCEHGVLESLIALAGTDPGYPSADLSTYIAGSSEFPYLSQLATIAQQLGFSDLSTKALQSLDAALETAAQRLVDFIKTRQSDWSIGAETQTAIADLGQETQLADAGGISGIDPGFDGFIQSEIASLSSNATVVLKQTWGQLCNGVVAFADGGAAPASLPLPVTRSGSGCGGQLTLTADMPNAKEIEIDADGFEGTTGYDPHNPTAMSLFGASVGLSVTLSSPATLQLELNPAWATSAPIVTLGNNTYTLGGFALVVNTSAGVFYEVDYDYSLGEGSFDSTPVKVPAGTYTVAVAIGSRNSAANAGSGWLARLTIR